MRTEEFDFYLPDALIAQFPAAQRNASRLLQLNGKTGVLADRQFRQLPDFLQAGDLLIFNDTRVIKARLEGVKESGGKVEVLIERILNEQEALAHIRASKAPKPGQQLTLAGAIKVTVTDRQEDLFLLRFPEDTPILDLLEQYGALPLPLYQSRCRQI